MNLPTPPAFFTYAGLQQFFAVASEMVEIFPLKEWRGQTGLLLRHDVDLAIDPAHRLAQIEHSCGVRSTFFIMMTNDWYNPCSSTNRSKLREMAAEGFEIGLHFDASAVVGEGSDDMRDRFEAEASLLGSVVGCEIESVSLHNPSISGEYPLFPGYNNAYDPRIFGPGRYGSDSRMVIGADLPALLTRGQHETVQLLLHPLHYSEKGGGYEEIFVQAMKRLFEDMDNAWRVNSSYAAAMQEGLLRLFLNLYGQDSV